MLHGYLGKAELTASIPHIVRFLKLGIQIYNSEVSDAAGRKTTTRRRTHEIVKRVLSLPTDIETQVFKYFQRFPWLTKVCILHNSISSLLKLIFLIASQEMFFIILTTALLWKNIHI